MPQFDQAAFQRNLDSLIAEFDDMYRAAGTTYGRYLSEALRNGKTIQQAMAIADDETGFLVGTNQALINKIVTAAAYGYGIMPEVIADPNGIRKALLHTAWTPDKMRLSERLHGNSSVMRQHIIDSVSNSMRQGKSFTQMARDLYTGYDRGQTINQAQLPKYLSNLENLARRVAAGDNAALSDFRTALAQARSQVSRLSPGGAPTKNLKLSYEQLVKAAERLSTRALDRAVHVAIQERSRYYAERIARTEMARAYAEGFIARNAEDDDVIGYRWGLSSRHPKYDICDFHKQANLYGMGSGVYPKNSVPLLPAHPHCTCHLSTVIVGETEETKVLGKYDPKAGDEFIKRLPADQQKALMGVRDRDKYLRGQLKWQEAINNWEEHAAFKARITPEMMGNLKPAEIKHSIHVLDTMTTSDAEWNKLKDETAHMRNSADVHEEQMWYALRNGDKRIIMRNQDGKLVGAVSLSTKGYANKWVVGSFGGLTTKARDELMQHMLTMARDAEVALVRGLHNAEERQWLRVMLESYGWKGKNLDTYKATMEISKTEIAKIVGAKPKPKLGKNATWLEKVQFLTQKKYKTPKDAAKAGQVIREEFQRRLKDSAAKTAALQARKQVLEKNFDEVAKQYRSVKPYTPEYEALSARLDGLRSELAVVNNQARLSISRLTQEKEEAYQVLMATLSEVRPFGSFQRHAWKAGYDKEVAAIIDSVAEAFPTAWWDKSTSRSFLNNMNALKVERGYYSAGRAEIALSGSKEHMRRVAFHEMGHRMDDSIDGLGRIVKDFLEQRTKGEIPYTLRQTEVFKKDKFMHYYMGRVYNFTASEIMSMGIETMRYDLLELAAKDPEYLDFILGLLGGY